jgi:hypothetical protein
LIGIILLYLGTEQSASLKTDWRRIRQRHWRAYLQHPPSLLVLLLIASLSLLGIGSLLTDFPYWKIAFALVVAGATIVILLLHFSQFRWGKYLLLLVFGAGFLVQAFFFYQHRADNIVHNRYGLTVYKGIPIPFFDMMFFPDGTFRLVDKKHYFNQRDQKFLLSKQADIIIIGSGIYGRGGRGFVGATVNHFIFNEFTGRGTQVIILKNPEACRLFNKLKQEQKNVLFVLHNTC